MTIQNRKQNKINTESLLNIQFFIIYEKYETKENTVITGKYTNIGQNGDLYYYSRGDSLDLKDGLNSFNAVIDKKTKTVLINEVTEADIKEIQSPTAVVFNEQNLESNILKLCEMI